MGLCLGITNPTALLGKGDVIQHWACHIITFSESSHTRRAVRALGSEFRRFGFSLSLSAPVPDKFEVSNPEGSFRGLSRGVAVASGSLFLVPDPLLFLQLAGHLNVCFISGPNWAGTSPLGHCVSFPMRASWL